MEISTTWAAIGAGAITSLHCVGMCGPLACSACMRKSGGSGEAAMALYHVGRITSYTLIGALCGALGKQPLSWFFDSPAVLLPWVLVALMVCLAFSWKIKIPTSLGHKLGWFKLRQKILGLGQREGALALGMATPFLPCGPLYLFFGVCLVSGSAINGAEFAFGFALGTVPLLAAAQVGFSRLRHLMSAKWLSRIQRLTALAAALMIAWRLADTLPFVAKAQATPTPPVTQSESNKSGQNTDATDIEAQEIKQVPTAEEQGLPSCCH